MTKIELELQMRVSALTEAVQLHKNHPNTDMVVDAAERFYRFLQANKKKRKP